MHFQINGYFCTTESSTYVHIIFFVGSGCMINLKTLGGYCIYGTSHSLSKSPLTILLQDSLSTILYVSPSALRGQPLWDYVPLPEASTVSLYFSNFYLSQPHGTFSILLTASCKTMKPSALSIWGQFRPKSTHCLHGKLVFWHRAVNAQQIQEVFGKMLACWGWQDATSTQDGGWLDEVASGWNILKEPHGVLGLPSATSSEFIAKKVKPFAGSGLQQNMSPSNFRSTVSEIFGRGLVQCWIPNKFDEMRKYEIIALLAERGWWWLILWYMYLYRKFDSTTNWAIWIILNKNSNPTGTIRPFKG